MQTLIDSYLEEVAKKYNKNTKIVIKDTSWFMKTIAFLLKPFNKDFMSEYITTIGNTIYVPKQFLETMDEVRLLEAVCHESIHVHDFNKYKLLYNVGYLFPQILTLLTFLSLLSIPTGNLLWLLCLGFVLFLLPLPAWWRYKFELRAYRTSVIFARKVWGYNDNTISVIHKWIINQLATRWYYFTWPFPKVIEKELKDESFMTISIKPEYKDILLFIERHKIS